MPFLQAGRPRAPLPGTAEPMSPREFSTALGDEVAEQRGAMPPPPKAHLWPREVVTVGLLQALTGGGTRAG